MYKKKNNTGFKFFKSEKEIKFVTRLKHHLFKIELILFLLTLIGYIYSFNIVKIVSLLSLALLYFLLFFAKYELNKKVNKITSNILLFLNCWGRSICISGILYVIINWNEPKFFLLLGLILLVLSILIYVYSFIVRIKDEIISTSEFLRNFIILLATSLFLLFDMSQFH